MPERLDDRSWVEAIDRYARRARRPARRRLQGHGPWILASALVLALTVSPFAIGATGDVLREGKRNPSSGGAHRETEIIASSSTYGTRQSNIRNGDGGGAIYGCRSSSGKEPCIRANNLKAGRAFEFSTRGAEGGQIRTKSTGGRPFTTNATEVATGLNSDRLDGLDASRIDFRGTVGVGPTDVLNLGGLLLRATCGSGPDLGVTATSSVADSTLHVSWNKDPGNAAFYRQENDLDPGETFVVMTNPNDDAAEGTISYSTPAGVQVSVTFQSEEGNAFGDTVPCLFAGTALGG
jgi:hypothetical protein